MRHLFREVDICNAQWDLIKESFTSSESVMLRQLTIAYQIREFQSIAVSFFTTEKYSRFSNIVQTHPCNISRLSRNICLFCYLYSKLFDTNGAWVWILAIVTGLCLGQKKDVNQYLHDFITRWWPRLISNSVRPRCQWLQCVCTHVVSRDLNVLWSPDLQNEKRD